MNLTYQTKKFPVLLQHFEGWTIKTEKSVFNSQTATLMDFSIDQKMKQDSVMFYQLIIMKL